MSTTNSHADANAHSGYKRRLTVPDWTWAWIAAIATWATTSMVTGFAASIDVISAAATFGAFFVLVALGQMFVVTLGPGNVDLSVPATMTLAGTVALKFMDGNAFLILPGILLAIICGVGVGLFNVALIRFVRIPPIIATLCSSFVFQSLAIWTNRGLRVKPPELLGDVATGHITGVPIIAILALLISVILHIALRRGLYGKAVLAIGQNPRAAYLAGIHVHLTRLLTYVLCATLAALCGVMLAAFSGGAALNMGEEYLLSSIAVVVIGGTSVAGGRANVPGLWGASLFLFLVVSMLNTLGFGAGPRLLLTGLIIIAVIVLASGGRTK